MNSYLTVPQRFGRWLTAGLLDLLILLVIFGWFVFLLVLSESTDMKPEVFAVVVLASIPLAVVAFLFARWYRVRFIRNRLGAEAGTLSLAELTRLALFYRRHRSDTVYLRELVRTLAADGRLGTSIRACPPWQAWPIVPVSMPFEPRQLKQKELQHDELFLAPLEEQVRVELWPQAWRYAIGKAGTNQPMAHLFKRGWRILKYLLIVLLFLVLLKSILLLLLVLLAVSGVWRGAFGDTGRHFLVPGGLVTRARWSANHTIFDRCRAVLGAVRIADDLWDVAVADTQQVRTLVLTDIEATALLMAWLSPEEPPTLEQLEGLL